MQCYLEILGSETSQKKAMKVIQIREKVIKLFLEDMIIYVENFVKLTRENLPE